jgi:MoaE-MoaD fusion protein
MEVKLLLFATLKELAGVSELKVELPDKTSVIGLKSHLVEKIPALKPVLSHVIVSVNQEFAFDQDEIPANSEVAIFPPVSGGSNYPTICKVITGNLDIDTLIRDITFKTTGAICVFTGIVRGETSRGEPHDTSALEYEAYIPMAESKMGQVADEIRKRWQAVEGIVIIQRIGLLKPGTPTVIIACSAAHRDTGVFEAARYGIDRLKEIVPVWKKEMSPNGNIWLEGDYIPERGD